MKDGAMTYSELRAMPLLPVEKGESWQEREARLRRNYHQRVRRRRLAGLAGRPDWRTNISTDLRERSQDTHNESL